MGEIKSGLEEDYRRLTKGLAHAHIQGTSDSHITFLRGIRSEIVDENVIKLLVGHEKEFIMKHYGGDPFSTERLSEEVSKVNC